MIPILYDADEQNFTSNGLGRLADAISCIVEEERNGIYELTMEYPVGGRHFGQLMMSNIIYCRASQKTTPQAFRIYQVTDAIDGVTTIRAQHISYQLTAIPVEPFVADNPEDVVSLLSMRSVVTNPFTFDTDIEEGEFNTEQVDSCRAIIGGIADNLLARWGAEVEWDMYDVHILQSRGQNRGKVVRYGKNITDITQEQSLEETYTGIYPYYLKDNDYVDLTEKVLLAPTASLYPYPRIMPVDFTGAFSSAPSEEALRAKAQTFLSESSIGFPRVSIEVSYVDDTDISIPIYLCDTVKVIFEPLGISTLAKVSALTWNVLLDRYETATIGVEFEDVASTVEQVSKSTEEKSVKQAEKKIQQSEQKTQQKIDAITFDYVEPQIKSTSSIPDGSQNIVMVTYFSLEASDRAHFCSTVNFHIAVTTDGTKAMLTVQYSVDGSNQTALTQTYDTGDHILTLDFLTGNLAAGNHVIAVAFGMVGGALS